jgi:hypothetical protein
MGLLRWLRGGDDELGWDDLIRRVVAEVAPLGRYGARGRVSFPPDVTVTIAVPAESAAVVRGFVEKPEFDREVQAAVANRCDCAPGDLPLCEYQVAEAEATAVRARESPARPWELLVEGGDRAGQALPRPRPRRSCASAAASGTARTSTSATTSSSPTTPSS